MHANERKVIRESGWVNVIEGVRARLSQLAFGVQKSVLTTAEARDMVVEQPAILELGFHTAFEDEHLVVVAKPWDAQLRVDDAGERWAGERTLLQYLQENHSDALTADGEIRLCHQLDFATSGLIVTAKSRAAADAVARCFREREARKLYAALVFGHPAWKATTWDARIMPSKSKPRVSGK